MVTDVHAALGPARDRILAAAEKVVGDVGAAHMTLDLVAQVAGVSKGGLLYHFPSKEALLGALAKRYVEALEEGIEAARDRHEKAGSAHDLKACIVGILHSEPRSKACGMGAAFMAAAAYDPTLLEVIRAKIAQYTGELAQSADVDFARAAIVTLAVDGLVMRESLRISPFSAEQREQVVQALLKLADEASPAP